MRAHVAAPLIALAALMAVVAGCSGTDTRVLSLRRVQPAADSTCGAPDDARTLLVRALGDFPASEATARSRDIGDGAPFSIETFPAETEALEVEILGTGGLLRAIGRSIPFDLDALEDGDEVLVFMAPRRGFCRTGPPAIARDKPLVARAGDSVLIAGGADGRGVAVQGVELYEPRLGAFRSLGTPLYGTDGFGITGASMTTLADGRVAIVGGAATAYQIFDPSDESFGGASFLREARAFHAAVVLPDGRLFLAGGCGVVSATLRCRDGTELVTTSILDVDSGVLETGPNLSQIRVGARAFLEPDGRVLLVGGIDDVGDPVTDAERIDPTRTFANEVIAGVGGPAALTDSGAVIAGFAPANTAGVATASVIPPRAIEASPVAPASLARAGASVTALEDGRVLVLGGRMDAAGNEAVLYLPSDGRFVELDPLEPSGGIAGRRRSHAAIRLADGSVFVVGGVGADDRSLTEAWIYRPDLVGPLTSDLVLTFGNSSQAEHVIPSDPARAVRVAADEMMPAHYRIESSGGGGVPSQWMVLGGPRFRTPSLTTTVTADSGGIAAMVSFVDAQHYAFVLVRPAERVELFVVDGLMAAPVAGCSGPALATDALSSAAGNHVLELTIGTGTVALVLDGTSLLDCVTEPLPWGAVGLGVIGDDGDAVIIESITVGR